MMSPSRNIGRTLSSVYPNSGFEEPDNKSISSDSPNSPEESSGFEGPPLVLNRPGQRGAIARPKNHINLYIPYAKDPQNSGVCSSVFLQFLTFSGNLIKKKSRNKNLHSFNETLRDTVEYIEKNQGNGLLGFDQQLEIEEIYYKLAKLTSKAESLNEGHFKASDLIRSLKRWFYTAAARYIIGGAAHQIKKSQTLGRAKGYGDATKSSKLVEAGGGLKVPLGPIGADIRVIATVESTEATEHGVGSSNLTKTSSGGLSLKAKLGIDIPGLPKLQPTDSYSGTALNIIGSEANAKLVFSKRDQKEFDPRNEQLMALNRFISSDDPHQTHSSSLFNWFYDHYYAEELQQFHLKTSIFKGCEAKEKGSVFDVIDHLIEAGLSEEDLKRLEFDTEATQAHTKNALNRAYEKFTSGQKVLPNSLIIKSTDGYSILGSLDASAYLGSLIKGKAKASVEYLWFDYKYHTNDIEIGEMEGPVYQKIAADKNHVLHENHYETHEKTFKRIEKEWNGRRSGSFTSIKETDVIHWIDQFIKEETIDLAYSCNDLSGILLRMQSKAGDKRFFQKQIDHIFRKLYDADLISKKIHEDIDFKEFILKDQDRFKTWITHLVLNKNSAIYFAFEKFIADHHIQLDSQTGLLKKVNEYLSRSSSFLADKLWEASTPAHTPTKDKYHQHSIALSNSSENQASSRTFNLSGSFQLSVAATDLANNKDSQGTSHRLNILETELNLAHKKTSKDPNFLRNRHELKFKLNFNGLFTTLLALGIDGLTELKKQILDTLPEDLETDEKLSIAHQISNILLRLHAAVGKDAMKNSGMSVLPNLGSSADLGSGAALEWVFNLSTKELDLFSITTTDAKGISLDIGSILNTIPGIPFSTHLVLSASQTQTSSAFLSVHGLYPLLELAEKRFDLHQIKQRGHALDRKGIQSILATARGNGLIAHMIPLGRKALDLKNKPLDLSRMQEECGKPELIEQFEAAFDIDGIDEASIQEYESAIHQIQSGTHYDNLNRASQAAIETVFRAWKKAVLVSHEIKNSAREQLGMAPQLQETSKNLFDFLNKRSEAHR